MKNKLERIAEISRNTPKEKFNNIIHLINIDMLMECHFEMPTNKATGVDKIDKVAYGENLKENLTILVEKLKNFSYKPQAVRRTYIPKVGSDKLRPLGIPAYEDRLVQSAMAKILTAIYEPHFMEFSYGFRENRGCHQALGALTYIIENKTIRYVVDADIKGFFDNVNHEWIIKFLEDKISDERFIRLVKRVIKAPIIENGQQDFPIKGMPQGGLISPVLSNIYLHYALDLWFEVKVKKECRYSANIVRYADDYTCCFESKYEAENFYRALKERLAKFELELAEDKTKIIMFGRYAETEMKNQNGKKPDTFDFLGFTHYCSRSRDGRRFRVKRTTSKKKKTASKKNIKKWMLENMHERPLWIFKKLNEKLRGYFNYYGVTDNAPSINKMRSYVIRKLFKVLRRRSDRNKLTWESFNKMVESFGLVRAHVKVNIYEVIKGLNLVKL
jgi:group II intron reverse transcriptase/maturase